MLWSITLSLRLCRLKIITQVKPLTILSLLVGSPGVRFDAFGNDLIVTFSHKVKEKTKTCCFLNVIPQILQESASDPGCISTLAECSIAWGSP